MLTAASVCPRAYIPGVPTIRIAASLKFYGCRSRATGRSAREKHITRIIGSSDRIVSDIVGQPDKVASIVPVMPNDPRDTITRHGASLARLSLRFGGTGGENPPFEATSSIAEEFDYSFEYIPCTSRARARAPLPVEQEDVREKVIRKT